MPNRPTYPSPDVESVTFHWSRNHGDCEDCGSPAAFHSTRYVLRVPLADIPLARLAPLCAVCAANDAVDGETITRIAPLD